MVCRSTLASSPARSDCEGNYTKDQINYSRSYYLQFPALLPLRASRTTYPVNSELSLTYWLVNGAQQTEDFNGFKSQAAIITIKPLPSVSWNVNYYNGREARDLNPDLNPGLPIAADPTGTFGRSCRAFRSIASPYLRHLRGLDEGPSRRSPPKRTTWR